jgi:hypothetical protein
MSRRRAKPERKPGHRGGRATRQITEPDDSYINQGPPQQRCDYIFVVDEHINLVEKSGSVRVFSTRGKKCGLEKDPNSTQGYCYWHEADPAKAKDPELRKRLEIAVQQKVYLGSAFLSGGRSGNLFGRFLRTHRSIRRKFAGRVLSRSLFGRNALQRG